MRYVRATCCVRWSSCDRSSVRSGCDCRDVQPRGETHEVSNKAWLVGDDETVVIIDAAYADGSTRLSMTPSASA